MNILRIRETINGRPYVIEVLPVGPERWRAQLAQVAGGTTALMPFYGASPGDAAERLSTWLTRAALRGQRAEDQRRQVGGNGPPGRDDRKGTH